MNKPTDIAIIGMSGVFPGAVNITAFWKNILNKVDAIQQAPQHRLDAVYFDDEEQAVDRFYCRRGGFIDEFAEFDPLSFGILPVAVEGIEPEHLLTLALAKQALADAGVWQRNTSLDNTGIIIGKGNYTGPGATRAIEIIRTGEQLTHLLKSALPHLQPEEINRVKKEFQVKKGRFGADTAMGLIPNLVASLVANRLNLGGTAYTVDAACASSLIAIDHAVQELTSGRLNMVIAGGVHVSQNAPFWSIFTQLGALSKKEQIRPFDSNADGLLIGEGCGFIILKRLEEALQDEDRIYAVIKGVGVASDGAAASVMSPSVKGQSKAIIQAWEKAGVPRTEIGYIEAHGTGTPLGDRTELETLQQVFGEAGSLPHAGIGSVKSMIGHAMPAAGIAGVIKTAMALYTGILPPTLHCEEPLALMNSTRFRPVKETEDWEASGRPRYAGINAFGFGGINAHVVLQDAPRRPTKMPVTATVPVPEKDAVIMLARQSPELLIKALQDNDTTPGTGPYRIALFHPDEARIKLAIKIIGRNKPWRNKQDIWYSNEDLVSKGGKVAFLFPGLDGLAGGEYASVNSYFQLQQKEAGTATETGVLSASLQLLQKSHILDSALKKLGVQPHLVAGHSLGEWLAGRSAGLSEEASIASLIAELQPEHFELPDTRFIVVGCSYSRVAPMLENIKDIYLSIDNCPQQVILCGTCAAVDNLMVVLKEAQIFHQVLAFQSGFHSPFIKDRLDGFTAGMDKVKFTTTTVPLWSATTLAPYPTDAAAIKALSVQHLTEPVYFRQLIEKLHEEGVRVFIQVGSGGLVGFVDDTLNLKHTTYSAVAANVPVRSGICQLQRVLAALFAEGADIDRAFMGLDMDEAPVRAAMKLQLGSPFVKDFTVLNGSVVAETPAFLPSNRILPAGTHPLIAAYMDNIQEMAAAQIDLLEAWQGKAPDRVKPAVKEAIQKQFAISLQSHPYLRDHSLLKQKPGWHCAADMDPVIPMTMIIELFAEAAMDKAPDEVVQAIRNIKVFQWMNVANTFTETITGKWQSHTHALLEMEKYALAEVIVGAQHKPAIVLTLETGNALPLRAPTVKEIYENHMFHGAAYQGIKDIIALGDKGITGIIEDSGGKGALLDNAGQLFGLWLQLVLPKDRIAFPVKIQEIQFYEDMHDQQDLFTCTCSLTELNDEFATADFVLERNNRVWAVIKGWQNRRLEIDDRLWKVSMAPLDNQMATEIAPGIFWFNHAYNRVVSWDFILKRYFNQQEKAHYQGLSVTRKKEWLISRVAVKDAVRALVRATGHEALYPIEMEITADAQGRPLVQGPLPEGIHISLAHKKTEAVAIARYHQPVGIDIEEITERGAGFKEMVFTQAELLLLAGKPEAEWVTRGWVAKEAYGKSLGKGLMGNPKAYEIRAINGDDILVHDTWITTIQHQNHIIGWTA